jgi:hypothetical protein
MDEAAPEVGRTFAALATAAVEDVIGSHLQQIQPLKEELERARVKTAHVEQLEARVNELEGTVGEQGVRLAAKVEELETAQKRAKFLSLLQSEAPPEQSARPRRKSVEGEPNIYFSEDAAGETVYEVGWREDGKQRWKTTGRAVFSRRARKQGGGGRQCLNTSHWRTESSTSLMAWSTTAAWSTATVRPLSRRPR